MAKSLVEVQPEEGKVLSQLHPVVRQWSAGGPWVVSVIGLELLRW